MSEIRYRLVFRGEIAQGFTAAEVKANLGRLCRFDPPTVDRIFASRRAILKSGLDQDQARKYHAALAAAGAMVSVEKMPESATASVRESPASLSCPKCGKEQPAGPSCVRCGIIFAKFRQVQEGRAAPGGDPAVSEPPAEGYFTRHQEQAFILKAAAMIVAILVLRQFLSGFILFLGFLFFPLWFLAYVRLTAATDGRKPSEVLAQHLTLMPVMYAEGERNQEGVSWVTYLLIAANLAVFYGIETRIDPQYLVDNLLFLPESPNAWNVPVSAFTAMFLHAGNGHLWGNMLFLWAVGTVVERRVGHGRFLVLYLVTGLAAGFMGVVIHRVFMNETLHSLGASGAISGIMGIFAVRCYFKSMVFPLPILGIFSLVLPISLKVRLNSLVIIGLFFLADLGGGFAQVAGGSEASNVGHWIHIGGSLAGIALAAFLRLGDQAIDERHLEIGAQAISGAGKVNLDSGEESLRLALRRQPDNAEAMLLLAKLLCRFGPSPEGEQLYRRAIALLCRTRPRQATAAFCEYHQQFLRGMDDPEVQYRLAGLFWQQGDLEMASRCLESLAADRGLAAPLREKSLWQYTRVLDDLGLAEAAAAGYQAFIDDFPDSAQVPKARGYLAGVAGTAG